MLSSTPEAGYDATLVVDLEKLPADKGKFNLFQESLIKSIALFKRNCLAAPFEVAFAVQQEGKESSLMSIHYRDNEAIYIRSMPDRVTVIFSTLFKDETDKFHNNDNKSIIQTYEYPSLPSSRSDMDLLEKVFDHIFKQENK